MARALVVSIARIENDPRYVRITRPDSTVQRERAFDLHEAANVPLGPCRTVSTTPCQLSDHRRFRRP